MNQILQSNIREKLNKKRMTVTELERRAGLKQTTIHNILLGRSKNPGVETVYALAKELGCTIEELISPPGMANHKSQSVIADLPWNEEILIKAVQFVGHFISKYSLNVSLEKALICIHEIYAYSLKENQNNTIDEKFSEWITEHNLLRN